MKNREKPGEYFYTSTECSQFYGMTVKGMEFYENKGIIRPERIGQGKVRRFSLEDSYRLYCARLLKNSGISLPKIMNLLEESDPERIDNTLGDELAALRRELKLQTMKVEALEHFRQMIQEAVREEPFFEIVEEPGFYRLFLRRFRGPHESSREETEEYRHWNDYLPITAASLLFPAEDCRADAENVDTQIGLVIDERAFRELGLQESNRTQHIPGGRFLHTIIHGHAQNLEDPAWIRQTVEKLTAKGLELSGPAFTRFIFIHNQGQESLRYDEAWFPVKEKA